MEMLWACFGHALAMLWALIIVKRSYNYNIIRPKAPCGRFFRLQIQFYPPKRPLRDAFSAQNIILSAQKPPAGCFLSSKYNFNRPKAPCGMLYLLKIQFHPPKRPLRDAFPAQNTILSAQKLPAECLSGSKYNFIRPKGPCGTHF